VLRWVALILAVAAVAGIAYGLVRLTTDDSSPAQFPTVDDGDVGAEVTAAQYLLSDHGVNDHVTGLYDDETEQAIRKFEARFPAVPDDGLLGPLTWSELVVPVQPGARGDAVKAVQTLLNDNGAALGVDGIFGPQTRDAVVAVERTNGFHVDGIVDIDVWKVLLAQSAA
jgi:peptidoglycan hydrolase-like protein with peptidoglycan-binding domain